MTCSPSNIADFFLIKILKPSDQSSLYVKARVMSAESWSKISHGFTLMMSGEIALHEYTHNQHRK